MSQDTLMAMGMQPSMLFYTKDGKETKVILFPYATLKFKKIWYFYSVGDFSGKHRPYRTTE